MVFDAWKHNAKGSAAIHPGLILERASVLLDDPCRDGQPQACAGVFGAKKGVE
jgi:hypothetical protein